MKEKFTHVNFHRPTLEMIHVANRILEEYDAQGFIVSLRQLYYRFIALDLFPSDRKWHWNGSKWVRDPRGTKNAEPNYKWLIQVMTDARMCGLVDWDLIEDRGRRLKGVNHRETPSEIMADAASGFRIDKWKRQGCRVEVWVEKDALVSVLEHSCTPLDVDFFSCKGNTSATSMYAAHERFCQYLEDGQQPVIIHLADHDPTGIDMTRDVVDRLATMVTQKTGNEVTVDRIALNLEQIRAFNPPPSPAKERDSRYQAYVERFRTTDCWELDALDIKDLDKLITTAILKYREETTWQEDVEREEKHREDLKKAAEGWDRVAEFVEYPERHITLGDEPRIWKGYPLPALKKKLRELIGNGNPENPDVLISICNDAVKLTASQFRKLAGAREKKKPTSIKTKKPKSPKS